MPGHASETAVQPPMPSSRPRPQLVPFWVWASLSAAATGGLMAACFPPFDLHFLAWIALVPWLVVLPKTGAGQAWLLGSIAGLVFYRIGLGWMFGLHGAMAGLAVCALSLWMGFAFRVVKLLMNRFSTVAMLWAVPLAFVGHEVLRCEGASRYRFSYLAYGYSQAENMWIAQIASIGGVHFVSFLLVAFNAALAYGLIRRNRAGCVPAALIGTLALIFAVVSQPPSYESLSEIPVACIQAETDDYHEYVDLTTQAICDPSRPVFIVLPEHTITEYADQRHPFVDRLAGLARDHHVYICVGAHIRAPQHAECYYDNVGLLIGPDGRTVGTQAKSVPVPLFQDGNPARTQAAFDTSHGRVGMFICYDGSFTDVPRRLTNLNAELLLVPVMNPKEWPVQQRLQQAAIARFRSIELRRCAIRAASSGISQIIDATGRVRRHRTQEQGPGVLYGQVYFSHTKTVFSRGGYLLTLIVGYAFLVAVALLTLLGWIGAIASSRRRKQAHPVGPSD